MREANTVLTQKDKDRITELLVGRRVAKVGDDRLLLDNGVTLTLKGHEGMCGCGSGDYTLSDLNGSDNVVTDVSFEDSPGGDGHGQYHGYYRIFVFAENRAINLATFSGSDGNGCYGTGYNIHVWMPPEPSETY